MEIRALTWNVFHGRDFPPDPALRSWRSRLLRIPARNDTHVKMNADLSRHFHAVLASAEWDVALLQEFPPRWAPSMARRCDADGHLVLTSRNTFARLRHLATRLNPDLIGSNEGGSNFVLVRPSLGVITERREVALCPGPTPERRVLSFSRTQSGICIANTHLSTGPQRRERAENELRQAARLCHEWAGGSPLILGGDLNIRPQDSTVYNELRADFDLTGTTADDSLDHLLVSGLTTIDEPTRCPAVDREVKLGDGRRLRLSDHAPVKASFRS